MSLVETIRSVDGMWARRDRMPRAGADDRAGLPPMLLADPALPRHILVALAAIIADVTSLQQRQVDSADPDPQVQASLDILLSKLDGLVDSIYERAASRR